MAFNDPTGPGEGSLSERQALPDHWAALTDACVHGGFRDAHETEVVSLWAHGELARLRTQVERLHAEKEVTDGILHDATEENERLYQENERLREALGAIDVMPALSGTYAATIARMALGDSRAASTTGEPSDG